MIRKAAPGPHGSFRHLGSSPRSLAAGGRLPKLATVLSICWVVLVALAYLAPALAHGTKLGAYDILTQYGLGSVHGVQVHNNLANDQVQGMGPWTALVWQQVHHGQVPLWNPYNGLGLPLAFNFQSAPFSLPMAIGYLVPQSYAYTVLVIVKLVIAGTGMLVLSRVLGLGALAGTMAATAFELSGSFTGWLGWPQSGVFCWLGWVMAATLLLLRSGTNRRRDVPFFAVVLALAIFGGHPESIGILLLTVAIFVVVVLVCRAVQTPNLLATLRPAMRVIVALVAGLALASPLLLPGSQVIGRSSHNLPAQFVGLPTSSAVNLLFAGFYGFPLLHSVYFGPINYYESAAYVGLTAMLLAALAVVSRWRDSYVIGLSVTAAVLASIVYVGPVSRLLHRTPIAKEVIWTRALEPLDFLLAVLAGIGLQTLLDRGHERTVRWRFAGVTAVGALGVMVLGLHDALGHLPSTESPIRTHSFLWPTIQVAAGILAAALLFVVVRLRRRQDHPVPTAARRDRWALAGVLIAAETAFLLTAAPHLWSSSNQTFAVTPAEAQLQQLVGQGRVGFGSCVLLNRFPDLGILPEANSAYGVAEIAVVDPIVPSSYFSSWSAATGTGPVTSRGTFCPAISSVALAQRYGVTFILEPISQAGPAGTDFVATVGSEKLYRVPGTGLVTIQPASAPAVDPGELAVPVSDGNPASIHFTTAGAQSSTLHIHLTNLTGWTAKMDGHPLALHTWDDTMLEASVPPGHHTIVLTYWPTTFTAGLAIAAVAALAMAVPPIVAGVRRRPRRRASGDPERLT